MPSANNSANNSAKKNSKSATKTQNKPATKAAATSPSNKVVLRGHIEVATDHIPAVMDALQMHIAKTRNEAGCLIFEVTPDQSTYGRFLVYEEFDSPAAFQAHQNRIIGTDWAQATKDARRFYTITGLDD